jgi:amino acid transporter
MLTQNVFVNFLVFMAAFTFAYVVSPKEKDPRRLILLWDTNCYHIHHWIVAFFGLLLCLTCFAAPNLIPSLIMVTMASMVAGILKYRDWSCIYSVCPVVFSG